MLDCACLAGIVALKHFRRPEIEVIGDEVTIVSFSFVLTNSSITENIKHDPSERAPIPLSINHTPFCLTFAFFSPPSSAPNTSTSAPITILDPSSLESTLCAGTISLALNAQKELCVLQKFGGLPLTVDEVLGVVRIAVARVKEIEVLVKSTLEADWKTRKAMVEGI